MATARLPFWALNTVPASYTAHTARLDNGMREIPVPSLLCI
jgi:hypothetical protein